MPFPLSTFFACAFAKKRAARRGLQRPRQNAPPRTRFESAPWHPMPPHRPPFRRENRRFRSAGASLQPLPPPGGVSHAPGCAPPGPNDMRRRFRPPPHGTGLRSAAPNPCAHSCAGAPGGRWRRKEGVLRQKQSGADLRPRRRFFLLPDRLLARRAGSNRRRLRRLADQQTLKFVCRQAARASAISAP